MSQRSMRIRSSFPRRTTQLPHVWIPMSDGARLAARVWLPVDAHEHPVPALLEYLPYRKNDRTADRDAAIHPYFAGYGYASVRVDIRGSGDSDGILHDEYSQQELEDGAEVIQWLAEQPWCTGAVGMFGKSWGGFNSLQVAALRPPALKAVISVDSTDDRYADDAHYMGGCLLGVDMLGWGATLLAYNARPPDPAVVGDGWRDQWLERLSTPPAVEGWLSHARRDDFWRHGSVGEDFGQLGCAVYMIGGWADPYRNAVLRLLAGYDGPRKGLIGPWAHNFPHQGTPEPAIGFLQDALRWWDHWLKDADTGIMDEPMLRVWMQDWIDPRTAYSERPGRWVAEPTWPSSATETRALALSEHALGGEPDGAVVEIRGVAHAGMEAGPYCPGGAPGEHPPDQRDEDGRSRCFDSAPLSEPLEVLGFTDVVLTVASDRPLALVACRLCDVSPDGSSLLVTRGLLNLCHRDGHEQPQTLEPGRGYRVRVRLNAIAHRFPAGHRIRLAVSPTYFPFAWPSPEPVTLAIHTDASSVELPARLESEGPALRPFEEPEFPPPLEIEESSVRRGKSRRVSHDVTGGRYELEVGMEGGIAQQGLRYYERSRDTFSIAEGAPLSAETRSQWTIELSRGDWDVRIETDSSLWGDAAALHLTNSVDAYEGGRRVFTRTWAAQIPRDHL
jgi:uncharacterized protein